MSRPSDRALAGEVRMHRQAAEDALMVRLRKEFPLAYLLRPMPLAVDTTKVVLTIRQGSLLERV